MIKRFTALVLVALALPAIAIAQTAKTRAALYTDTDTLPAPITRAALLPLIKNVIASSDNAQTDGTGVVTSGSYSNPAWITGLDWSKIQTVPATLVQIGAVTGNNDDVLQKKSGSWVSRSPAQLKADLALVKGDVGLGNVDNTSDATKNAAAVTLTNKTLVDASTTLQDDADATKQARFQASSITAGQTRVYQLPDANGVMALFSDITKANVGLGNADNTSDANKPVSTATQTALNGKVDTTRTISTQHSLTGGGDLSANRTLNLVGDSASPGNSKYYGTDGAGTRGFHSLPSGGSESTTASNVGTGAGIWKELVGADLRFKSVTNGANITITSNTNDVNIAVSGLAAVATSGSAGDLDSGTLLAARLPAHTGEVTSSAGSAALTIDKTIAPTWTGNHRFNGNLWVKGAGTSSLTDTTVPVYLFSNKTSGSAGVALSHQVEHVGDLAGDKVTAAWLVDLNNSGANSGVGSHGVAIIGRADDREANGDPNTSAAIDMHGIEGKRVRRGSSSTGDGGSAVFGIHAFYGSSFSGRTMNVFTGFGELATDETLATPVTNGTVVVYRAYGGTGGDSANKYALMGSLGLKILTGDSIISADTATGSKTMTMRHDGTDGVFGNSHGHLRVQVPAGSYFIQNAGQGFIPNSDSAFNLGATAAMVGADRRWNGFFNTLQADGTVTFNGTWADGVKQTFNPNGTNAGINVGSHAGNPSSLANGDLWYNSSTNEFNARINGATVALGPGGGGSGDVTAAANFGTDEAVLRADGTGKGAQASTITIDDVGALTVPEMTAPSTPASGKVKIYAKSDGKIYRKDDAGTEAELGGGSGTQSLRDKYVYLDSFLRGTELSTFTNGSGANVGAASSSDQSLKATGELVIETGTSSSGWAGVTSYSSYFNANVRLDSVKKMRAGVRVRFPTLSNGTDRYNFAFGFADGGGSMYLGFQYRDDVMGGEWRAHTNGSEIDSNVAVVADTWYAIEWEGTTGSVEFFINGTSIGSLTTNIPTDGYTMHVRVDKTAGTNNRKTFLDWYGINKEE